MKTYRIAFGLILLTAGITLSGCYTQFATTEKDPYAEHEQGYTTEDTSGASGYYDSRERFYSDYYVTQPFTFSIGATFWNPWGYPGYGYGGWWFYDPWYYPYYPGYYGGYGSGWYYPYFGGYHGYSTTYYPKPSGVRTFGSGRYNGGSRVAASGGTTSPGVYRPAATTSPSFLPSGVRSTSPRGGSMSGREGGSRPAPSSTQAPTRTGSTRERPRGERVPAYIPPPPPHRESPRQSADRPSGGNTTYSPPPSAPSHSSPPPSNSSPREGGNRSGGSESGSGGGRSGSRR